MLCKYVCARYFFGNQITSNIFRIDSSSDVIASSCILSFLPPTTPFREQFSHSRSIRLGESYAVYCNTASPSIEAGQDALKCDVYAEGRAQFRTDQVWLSWPGPLYVLCLLCPRPPSLHSGRTRGREQTEDTEETQTSSCYEGLWGKMIEKQPRTLRKMEFHKPPVCSLPTTISNITASASTARAGSSTESRVGGWAAGQEQILKSKFFQEQVRDISCYDVRARVVHWLLKHYFPSMCLFTLWTFPFLTSNVPFISAFHFKYLLYLVHY